MTSHTLTSDRATAGIATSWLELTQRALRRFARTPQLVVVGTVQMALFMLIYRYMFGGAINTGRIDYVDYLVPGFVTSGVLFMGIGTSVAMAQDLEGGLVDRLRSMPIPRSAVLAARAIADTAILAWSLGVAIALGFVIGFDLQGSAI